MISKNVVKKLNEIHTYRGSVNLLIGQVRSAWLQYPSVLRGIRSTQDECKQSIMVTGPMRSGTTWVGQMLSSSGIWHIHEPFNPNRGVFYTDYMYQRPDSSHAEIDSYVEKLLSGHYRTMSKTLNTSHPLMPGCFMPLFVKRVLIKDPNACLLSLYLTERFDLKTIVMFRHPVAWAHSLHGLGWGSVGHLKRFLQNEMLMDDYLGSFETDMVEAIDCGESLESIAVLHGCLSSILWRFCEKSAVMRAVKHEDLCHDPISAFQELHHFLELPYDESVRKTHIELCSGEDSRSKAIYTHDVRRMTTREADKWRFCVVEKDIEKIRGVWERFNLPLYRSDSEWRIGLFGNKV